MAAATADGNQVKVQTVASPVGRPGTTESSGRRIYERQFYVTQKESNFRASRKVFTSIKQEGDDDSNVR